jgi:transcriptional regulator MraZ
VFKGTHRHRVDPKGRLPVPAPFRRELQASGESRLVVTLLDQCLAAYPTREWEQLERQLRALPAFNRTVRALTRLLTSRAADCELDVQGRILLPSDLREAVGIGRDAVVVGVLNRIEVWPPHAWESFVTDSERLLDDVSLDIQWPPPVAPPTPSAGELPQPKPKR